MRALTLSPHTSLTLTPHTALTLSPHNSLALFPHTSLTLTPRTSLHTPPRSSCTSLAPFHAREAEAESFVFFVRGGIGTHTSLYLEAMEHTLPSSLLPTPHPPSFSHTSLTLTSHTSLRHSCPFHKHTPHSTLRQWNTHLTHPYSPHLTHPLFHTLGSTTLAPFPAREAAAESLYERAIAANPAHFEARSQYGLMLHKQNLL